MTVPPEAGPGLAKVSLQLLNTLAAIVLKSKQDKSSRLPYSEVIKRMGADIHGRALELQTELKNMETNLATLRDHGYAVDKPLQQVRESAWFYKVLPFAPYKMLRNFGSRITSIAGQCETIFSDVLSVANCREAEEEVAEAVAKSRDSVRALAGPVNAATPMTQVIKLLREEADALVKVTNGL